MLAKETALDPSIPLVSGFMRFGVPKSSSDLYELGQAPCCFLIWEECPSYAVFDDLRHTNLPAEVRARPLPLQSEYCFAGIGNDFSWLSLIILGHVPYVAPKLCKRIRSVSRTLTLTSRTAALQAVSAR